MFGASATLFVPLDFSIHRLKEVCRLRSFQIRLRIGDRRPGPACQFPCHCGDVVVEIPVSDDAIQQTEAKQCIGMDALAQQHDLRGSTSTQ
ncbi:hypothetical protein LK09_07955 [Microbacterium mangrovi]|uniref:Uncharacterized protein n=1 Tax=Microbacterium mangrovi TaxID=1348253 RepID=A0A0B2AAP3_9MICO|nr:hypothetical protein LK09_07955 [Microbacterium mangrovi]